jgi:hypothetical protein
MRRGLAAAGLKGLVPPTGFEPVISTLKGWRPRPLDDGGPQPGECTAERPTVACIAPENARAGPPVDVRPGPPKDAGRYAMTEM